MKNLLKIHLPEEYYETIKTLKMNEILFDVTFYDNIYAILKAGQTFMPLGKYISMVSTLQLVTVVPILSEVVVLEYDQKIKLQVNN